MRAETRSTLKVISGTVLLIGLFLGSIERYYAPNAIVTDNSTVLPEWVGWTGWAFFSGVATVVYVLLDVLEWRGRRR
jgi:hypothetical protein